MIAPIAAGQLRSTARGEVEIRVVRAEERYGREGWRFERPTSPPTRCWATAHHVAIAYPRVSEREDTRNGR